MRTKENYHQIHDINVSEDEYFKLVELSIREKRDITKEDVLALK